MTKRIAGVEKSEIGKTQKQVQENYLRLCDKYGWKKPGKWAPRAMAKGKGAA
jgi:hypothetical protein